MNRLVMVLVVLSIAACKEKTPPIAPEARGAAFFAPTADRFGELVLADLKAAKPAWYADYLKQTGARNDAELLQKMQIGKGILSQYAASFAITEAQESAMKAGRFDDQENRKKVTSAAARLAQSGQQTPDAHRIALQKVESGEWGKGVELEFAVRLLQGQPAKH